MTTLINRLSARQVDTLGLGFHSDGRMLYLRVRGQNTRSWIFRYSRLGKAREIGLGATYQRSLSEARAIASDMRKALKNGTDPATVVRVEEVDAENVTFKSCALELIESKRPGWSNPKHIQQWENTLSMYAYPFVGSKHPADVTLTDIKNILSPIWETKTSTATRVRQRVESVIDWAFVHGHRTLENPARWKGMLDKVLPQPHKIAPIQHFASMPYPDVPAAMKLLREKSCLSANCLRFLILTGTRSGEARGLRWDELNLSTKIWTIPSQRIKTRKEHRVPLTNEAMQIIKDVPRFVGQELVFPGTQGGLLSDVALSKMLRSVYKEVTVHGFRSSFRQWAAEKTDFPSEVCELALAHSYKDKIEGTYQRSDLIERRRDLMTVWNNFLTGE